MTASDFIRIVAEAAGDDEVAKRVSAVAGTLRRSQSRQPFTGFGKVKDLLGDKAASKLRSFLPEIRAHGGGTPTPRNIGFATATVGGVPFHLTDSGNAERLVAEHGLDIRYCRSTGAWFVWDGHRFASGAIAEVHQRAKATIQAMYAVAGTLPDMERQSLVKHAFRSEAKERRKAVVELAAFEPNVQVEPAALDADPFLLNVENGALNLRTGELRPHRRDDLITKLVPITFDSDATCPTWESFLRRVLGGDAELIAFVRRAVGYSLTGDVGEQVLFFLHGSGANGKSTFCVTLLVLAGEYGKQAAPDLLVTKRGEAHPTEQADLLGARLVVSQEVEQGRAMAEVAVKQITGGDRIKARYMRQDFFEFSPTHKLWLAANHKPLVRGTDYAIWRRILLVPFTVTIPPEERDRHLPDKLRAELPGILNWAVQGCLEWQRTGLCPPKKVTAATAEYRAEMDIIGDFLSEECVLDPQAKVSGNALYEAFKAWCEASGERAVSQKALGGNLAEREGLTRKKSGGRIVWQGLRLRDGKIAAQAVRGASNGEDGEDDDLFSCSSSGSSSHKQNGEISVDPRHPPHENRLPTKSNGAAGREVVEL